jgi:predicted metal-dependent phosphoesterase TrpH
MFADLHLHSTFSDGTDTSLELCRLATEHHVQVISITDHDTVGGQKELRDLKLPQDVKVIPGIEISTLVNRKMQHILGYYIDLYDEKLDRLLAAMSVEWTENTRLNFEKARSDNVFTYEWKRVLELNPNQPRIGGTSVIKAMEIDGYQVPGMKSWDMFRKCFWPENDDYISHCTFNGYDAIDTIKAVGGIPVIAHPKSINNDDIVIDLIQYGAQGLEVYHPTHNQEDIKRYLQMADDKRLYITGGTDWHGKNNRREITHFGMCGLENDKYPILSF